MTQRELVDKYGFFVLEGVEGCGKSSTSVLLKEKLEEMGYDVVVSREPGGTELAEKIREILVEDEMLPISEMLLFLAARYEHYMNVVKPAVDDNKIVILDRYIPTSIAIQGHAKGLFDTVIYLHELVMPKGALKFTPIFIDINVEDGLKRKSNQENGENKFEHYGVDFHKRVREGYGLLIDSKTFDFMVVDGYQTPSEIVEDILNSILN